MGQRWPPGWRDLRRHRFLGRWTKDAANGITQSQGPGLRGIAAVAVRNCTSAARGRSPATNRASPEALVARQQWFTGVPE